MRGRHDGVCVRARAHVHVHVCVRVHGACVLTIKQGARPILVYPGEILHFPDIISSQFTTILPSMHYPDKTSRHFLKLISSSGVCV